jgi:lambda family phage minor tail protein L
MSLIADLSSLSPTAQIELFELDLTALGGDHLYFHAGTNQLGVAVVWKGQPYTPASIQAEGFNYDGSGPLPRPKLRIGNVTDAITGYLFEYDDLQGARVIRRRTMARYLDAVNFAAGNSTADPSQQFQDEIFFVDRVSDDQPEYVELELAASYDIVNARIPSEVIVDNICSWEYRSGLGCDWAPDPVTGPFFDANDAPTTSLNDVCSQRLSGCKCRFLDEPLPFGAFLAAGLVR